MSANDSFRDKFAAFIEKTKANRDMVVQKVAMDMLSSLVMKSPVGNPDLWKGSTDYAEIDGVRQAIPNSTRAAYVPPGYVGGRFRANWIVSEGEADTTTTDEVDASGSATIADGTSKILSFKIGGTLFLTNSLPYGQPLEYGHSTQAPSGMVRLTVAETDQFFTNAVGGLDK